MAIRRVDELDENGDPVVPGSPADTTTPYSADVRSAAIGKLRDSLLATTAPPKAEDPIFKIKRLMKAGVPNPLQTAISQKLGR